MHFSCSSLLLIGLVALTACGGEPDAPLMDRRFLTVAQLDQQAEDIRARATGELLDTHEWTDGEHRVLTLLARDRDAEGYEGIFLRHFQLGQQGPQLLWTYQDSISCAGAAAGAKLVANSSPVLRPGAFTADGRREFVLRYHLACFPEPAKESNRALVVVDAATGTPRLRFEGHTEMPEQLSPDRAERLLAIWAG